MTQTPETSVPFSTLCHRPEMKSAEQKSRWGVGDAVWVEVQKAGPSWRKWEKEPQSGEATNDRAHAYTSTERWNMQILPIYNHKLPAWKHFNIKSTGTCTVFCHLLQSETNVSRVTTAWARKLIQLNTRTVWRDNRGKGNPNYQRERGLPSPWVIRIYNGRGGQGYGYREPTTPSL